MLTLRKPHGREEEEARFEEVGPVVVLVTQDFGCSPGSSPTCHPLASACSVQGSQGGATEPDIVGWFQ